MLANRDSRRGSSLKGLNSSKKCKNTGGLKRMQTVDSISDSCLNQRPSATKVSLIISGKLMVQVLDQNANKTFFAKFFTLGGRTKLPSLGWEYIEVALTDDSIFFKDLPASNMLSQPVLYKSITHVLPLYITKHSFHGIKITSGELSFIIQVSDEHIRDRWFHSLQWKRSLFTHRTKLCKENTGNGMLLELKNLIDMTVQSSIHLTDTRKTLLDIISTIFLQENNLVLDELSNEDILNTLEPLASNSQKSEDICNFFIKHCKDSPRSQIIVEMFTPMIEDILKYTSDFGKAMWLRTFVRVYIEALASQNNGKEAVLLFIKNLHGPLSTCPHLRIAPNMVSVCLSAIYHCFVGESESVKRKSKKRKNSLKQTTKSGTILNNNTILNNSYDACKKSDYPIEKNVLNDMQNHQTAKKNNLEPDLKFSNRYSYNGCDNDEMHLDPNLLEFYKMKSKENRVIENVKNENEADLKTALLFADILVELSQYSDWLPSLAKLLQPMPFPEKALNRKQFLSVMKQYATQILNSENEELVWYLLSTRNNKKGWIQVFGINGTAYSDGGNMFKQIAGRLLECAIKSGERKMFTSKLYQTQIDDVMLMALREDPDMIKILCLMLDYDLGMTRQMQIQIYSTLQSTKSGEEALNALCNKEEAASKLNDGQAFVLPPQSTDLDLENFLRHLNLNHLQSLDLSFTFITSASAEIVSQLTDLKHLNLWSCNISDQVLSKICETLNLKSLNLCETQVTDKGIRCLRDMTNLEILNLNSTNVSCEMVEELKETLPRLSSLDITYSPADI